MKSVLCTSLFVLFVAVAAPPGRAQTTLPPASMGGTVSGFPDARSPHRGGDGDGPRAGIQEKLEKGRLSDRQKRMIADTDRLLALANELKTDMDKTTKDQLSIEVIKKAEEIEKLAKSVKDRMKG